MISCRNICFCVAAVLSACASSSDEVATGAETHRATSRTQNVDRSSDRPMPIIASTQGTPSPERSPVTGCYELGPGKPSPFPNPSHCKDPPKYATTLSNSDCIARAKNIQLQWQRENAAAGNNGQAMRNAERRAQTDLRTLFRTVCAHHPDARTWIAKADQVLSGTGSGFAGGSGAQSLPSRKADDASRYYSPVLRCLAIQRAQNSNFAFCIYNACAQPLEASFSGGMVSVAPQRCVPISAGPNPTLYAACNKNDLYDKARGQCRR